MVQCEYKFYDHQMPLKLQVVWRRGLKIKQIHSASLQNINRQDYSGPLPCRLTNFYSVFERNHKSEKPGMHQKCTTVRKMKELNNESTKYTTCA